MASQVEGIGNNEDGDQQVTIRATVVGLGVSECHDTKWMNLPLVTR